FKLPIQLFYSISYPELAFIARDTAAQSAQVSRACDPPCIWCPAGHRFTARPDMKKAVSRQLQFI
ncbi:hypothetical protein, partial [Duncaniella muris]